MAHIDKNSIKHVFVCFLLSLVGVYGMCVAVGAAITKEYCDKQSYGHWCWFDLLFDFLGCAGGIGIHWWIFRTWNF